MLGGPGFGGLVAVVLGAASLAAGTAASGVLGETGSTALDDLAQLAAGLFAAASCLVTARRAHGPDRRWRVLLGLGALSWSAGQAAWTWQQLVLARAVPSPTIADAGYLGLVPFALAALLVLGGHRGAPPPEVRTPLVPPLDGLIVAGSLFLLTWSSSLGALVARGGPDPAAFLVAVAYPVTDLVLLVVVVVLAAGRDVLLRSQLRLIGLGLVGLAVSDGTFAYLVSAQAPAVPPLANAGFTLGPALLGLAALAPPPADRGEPRASAGPRRAHLLLPYLPLLLSWAVVLHRTASGTTGELDGVEVACGFTVFGAVVARQLVALVANTRLAALLRASERELAHRATHDALTGLAGRALFERRLAEAVAEHHVEGTPFGVLFVDLDRFKAVNDTEGHASGDALLGRVAGHLRACVRDVDVVARLGGDEFAVLITGAQDPEAVGRRVLAELGGISASLGVVVCADVEPEDTAQAVLHRADQAMYRAKRRGGGGLVVG
ncbi:GGDEF domain-containing protein [Actinosynnema pretiosum]|uniref:GGDEF domain-containing protein n=1 Tax=Actinosynnema pretiosum TaxID=42197 RepID=A0A290ZAR9_9PSEU|nr:GGDEF domain-containing protein [Actinosynnema pretiosum]ATE56082.1 GGDEF domain-containing protein [Actinosynnema pretiosum]